MQEIEFEPLINKLVRENYINTTVDADDLKQKLRLKLFEIMPRLSYTNDSEKEQVFKWVKCVFSNLITDTKIKEINTPGASFYSLSGLDLSELVGAEMSSIFDKMSDHNQEDNYIAKELQSLIIKFAETQSYKMRRFILERINTSDEVESLWQERLKKSPRCKNAKEIPIWSMLDILELNQRDFYKMREDLIKYLGKYGYTLSNKGGLC